MNRCLQCGRPFQDHSYGPFISKYCSYMCRALHQGIAVKKPKKTEKARRTKVLCAEEYCDKPAAIRGKCKQCYARDYKRGYRKKCSSIEKIKKVTGEAQRAENSELQLRAAKEAYNNAASLSARLYWRGVISNMEANR